MKTKRSLLVVGLVGMVALISAAYCFWLMTVPLSYDLVYVVLAGFLASFIVFVIALIGSVIIAIRLRRSSRAPHSAEIAPPLNQSMKRTAR
jgi:membrane protein implicated in regulation of membrane protease activity